MSDHSQIQWTDATWNPTTGCTKVSPGCANCYIERTPAFRIHHRKFVKGDIPLQIHFDRLDQPLHWKKPRRVFVNSLSDLFHADVPDRFIFGVFEVMARASQHTFQVLTKRPARMLAFLTTVYPRMAVASDPNWPRFRPWPIPNVWLGVSVENQYFADLRIPILLQTPAAVRFISAEPLLGPVRLNQQNPDGFWPPNAPQPHVAWLRHKDWPDDFQYWSTGLDWVIVGGESGRGARPFHVDWATAIVQQCKVAGVPCFVKQLGADPRWGADGWKLDMLKDRKGGDMAEWPDYYVGNLKVREFPAGHA